MIKLKTHTCIDFFIYYLNLNYETPFFRSQILRPVNDMALWLKTKDFFLCSHSYEYAFHQNIHVVMFNYKKIANIHPK